MLVASFRSMLGRLISHGSLQRNRSGDEVETRRKPAQHGRPGRVKVLTQDITQRCSLKLR